RVVARLGEESGLGDDRSASGHSRGQPGRKGYHKARASGVRALRLDGAAMQFDDLLADVEPEPHSSETATTMRLIEAIEDVRSAFFGNANPMVPNRDLHGSGVGLLRVDLDLASVGTEFHGVVHQIGQHLLQAK